MKCQHSRWHASKSFTRESCHRVVERHEYGSLLKLHIMQWIWSFPHSSRELLMLKWSAAGKPTSAELQHWMKRTTTGWVMFSHSSAVDYTSTVKGLAQIEFNSCSNFYGYCRQYYRVGVDRLLRVYVHLSGYWLIECITFQIQFILH